MGGEGEGKVEMGEGSGKVDSERLGVESKGREGRWDRGCNGWGR